MSVHSDNFRIMSVNQGMGLRVNNTTISIIPSEQKRLKEAVFSSLCFLSCVWRRP